MARRRRAESRWFEWGSTPPLGRCAKCAHYNIAGDQEQCWRYPEPIPTTQHRTCGEWTFRPPPLNEDVLDRIAPNYLEANPWLRAPVPFNFARTYQPELQGKSYAALLYGIILIAKEHGAYFAHRESPLFWFTSRSKSFTYPFRPKNAVEVEMVGRCEWALDRLPNLFPGDWTDDLSKSFDSYTLGEAPEPVSIRDMPLFLRDDLFTKRARNALHAKNIKTWADLKKTKLTDFMSRRHFTKTNPKRAIDRDKEIFYFGPKVAKEIYLVAQKLEHEIWAEDKTVIDSISTPKRGLSRLSSIDPDYERNGGTGVVEGDVGVERVAKDLGVEDDPDEG